MSLNHAIWEFKYCENGISANLLVKPFKITCSTLQKENEKHSFGWISKFLVVVLLKLIKKQLLFATNSKSSLVIRQKGESQNESQENKARQIFRKTNIFYSLIGTRTCAYQAVRNVRFSENLMCFVFL